MLNETDLATWASMVKWRNQCVPHLVTDYFTINANTCALCMKFDFNEYYSEDACVGCPVYESGNDCRAFGTPYNGLLWAIRNGSSVEQFDAVERLFDLLADLCPPMPDN